MEIPNFSAKYLAVLWSPSSWSHSGPLDQEGQWPCHHHTPSGQLSQIPGGKVKETYSLGGNLYHIHDTHHFLEQTPHVWGSSRHLSTIFWVRSWNPLSLSFFAALQEPHGICFLPEEEEQQKIIKVSESASRPQQSFMVEAVRLLIESDNLNMAPSQSRIPRDSVKRLMFFTFF